jgi:hypothetical protein
VISQGTPAGYERKKISADNARKAKKNDGKKPNGRRGINRLT